MTYITQIIIGVAQNLAKILDMAATATLLLWAKWIEL
jgi:hypothetical protein